VTVCGKCGHENPEDARFCNACAAPLETAPASREQRKTVTVLFCDVTGSTSLGESTDPETLRSLLARYFERMKQILESHGGSVEKFIGDAVMAVFGVPQVHEDDALRAVRAAVEMRDAVPELGLQARIGVNTGEVVTGTQERLATGDAVNVAARLEQAASPGEILIGSETLRLVRDAVEAEPVEPLELKGKSEPVTAFRLLDVIGEPERTHGALFVGRSAEVALIRAAWERALNERACQLVTIVGEAGVGKSRLVAEALGSTPERVVRGRCLPYGQGITYWPVVEVIKQLDALPTDKAAENAIRSLLRERDRAANPDEIAWAVRKLFEESAPLVCIFDDIQWSEDTFLELVEHVTFFAGGPLLVACMARPELTERQPEWEVTLRLEPLPLTAVDELIPDTVSDELRQRIRHAAGGNPLFVQEMVAIAGETEGEVVVPPTLAALLSARLDQLAEPERAVLELGAVEGEVFHRGSVQALSEDGNVTPRLTTLVRKSLVRPDRSQLPGDDAFRFRHILLRDAAYESLPKAKRANLHERFARWLEAQGAELVELDEILGYHLEQAVRYRRELGADVEDELVASARRRLTAAGLRARSRTDLGAATHLLTRAAALVPAGETDLKVEIELCEALFYGGRGDEAIARMDALVARAAESGNRVLELCGRIQGAMYRISRDPEGVTDELEGTISEALPLFEDAGDDIALYAAYTALGQVANMRARADQGLMAFEKVVFHGQRAGLPHDHLGWRGATFRLVGTTPFAETLAWIDQQEQSDFELDADRAHTLASLGRVDEARELLVRTREHLSERGSLVRLAGVLGIIAPQIELLGGDARAAAEVGEEGCSMLESLGDRGVLSSAAGILAQAYCELGALDLALVWADRAAAFGASDDALTQVLWRRAKARVCARQGKIGEANRLADEAITIVEATDLLDYQAGTYADLAEVRELAGEDPRPALEHALACYERKGNLVMVGRMRERLAVSQK
jgi:class 3 adenylate cyclase/tetratricopeptide (TPR) repeat protein